MTGFDALLLDFGGVIARTLFECRADIEAHFALAHGSLDWFGPLDPSRDELWRSVLAGKMSEQDYWRERLAGLGQRVARSVAMADIFAALLGGDANRMIRPEAVAAVGKIKAAGYRVGVLTNDLARICGAQSAARIMILREVDCVLDGSWSGVHKPSPEAYARALAALGSAARRTLFVDDQPRNVAGAEAAGLAAIMFDVCHPAASFAEIERRLAILRRDGGLKRDPEQDVRLRLRLIPSKSDRDAS
jgi:putative hydrolase of the HAD superfamily